VHARPQIREILIERKMTRWCRIAQCPLLDPRCPPARARRNFWRLCARYPEVMQRLGYTATSVYEG
jgi:hypothetical protein